MVSLDWSIILKLPFMAIDFPFKHSYVHIRFAFRLPCWLLCLSSEGYRSVHLMRTMHHCHDLCCLLLNWNSLNLAGSHLLNSKDRHWVQPGFLPSVCQVIPHQYHPLENTLYNVNTIQRDRCWKNKNHLRQVNKDSFVSPSFQFGFSSSTLTLSTGWQLGVLHVSCSVEC